MKFSDTKQELIENNNFKMGAFRANKHASADRIAADLHKNTCEHVMAGRKEKGSTHSHLKSYTEHEQGTTKGKSYKLNKALATGQEVPADRKDMHRAIKESIRPAGREVNVYSGSKYNFSDMAKKDPDHIFYSPAHISATHNADVAIDFASGRGLVERGEPVHIMNIKVDPKDLIVHVGKISSVSGEHETIIPSGTSLKYHSTTKHQTTPTDKRHHKYQVEEHHFTIAKQEDRK